MKKTRIDNTPILSSREEKKSLSVWEQRYKELVLYRAENGHCNVPQGYNHNKKLFFWVKGQKKAREKMSEEKRNKLIAIGFDFSPQATEWNERYQELVEFHQLHGHCNVPHIYKENRKLSIWVNSQRNLQDSMNEEKKEKLSALGLDWNPHETYWNERYEELVEFRKNFGNCNVPNGYKENKKLSVWVNTQRKFQDKLNDVKRDKLNAIGFDWNPNETLWNERYTELVEYQQKTGHCRVPQGYAANKALGTWVNTQRKSKDTASEDRKNKLNAIGFEWELRLKDN